MNLIFSFNLTIMILHTKINEINNLMNLSRIKEKKIY